jgi:hypothetical protein
LLVSSDEWIAAGEADSRTELLHGRYCSQVGSATPIGVFTGLRESMASHNAQPSIHSDGASCHSIFALDRLLSDAPGRFQCVVLEPAGLPATARADRGPRLRAGVRHGPGGALHVRS